MNKVNLNEICQFLNGYAFKSKQYVDDGIRVIRIANVQKGKIIDDAPCFYPINTKNEIEKYMLFENDLLISLTGNVGRVGLLTKDMLPAALNQRVSCIRIINKDVVFFKYLYYYLQQNAFERDCIKASNGVAQLNLSTKWLENYQISLPSLEKQQLIVSKIEELFSKLEKGVEELNKIKEQLKNYRQAVLKETLESNKPNHRVEDVVISFQNGIAKRSGKEGREILVLRLADVSNDSVIVSNDMRRILLSEEEQKTYVLDKDDAIIIRVNGSPDRVGRMILVDQGNAYAFCDHLIRCKFNEKIVLPKYVKYCMDASACRKYIKENMVSTAGQNTISQSTIKNCPIFVPNIKEQETLVKQIESRLSVCDKIEQTVNGSLQKAESLRQSILKQAFEGKLV